MLQRILKLLKGAEGYVSGQRMSAELGLTRAAVWKKIKMLRQKGFVIEAVPSQGYKLIFSADLSVEEILCEVKGDFWKEILFHERTGSTNELAASLSLQNDHASGTVIIADMQEKGKGRLGRRWISPPGVNIYMSVILRPEMAPRDATLLTLLSAVACTAAIRAVTGVDAGIKWPNDLIASGKKLGGILTEVKTDPDRIDVAVVGIGINVNVDPADFPEEIKGTATSIRGETGRRFSRSGIIIRILKEIEYWFRVLKSEGRVPLLQEWRRLSFMIGREVTVSTARGVVSGTAEDIDDEGMLVLRLPSGEKARIISGDVTSVR